jgi:3-hydroxyisobutyrate dehydrogenase
VSANAPSVSERFGFVGLGTMGSFMATNLVNAGFPLTVWNRTPGRCDALVALGALKSPSPAELARSCDVVVACLTDSPQVEEVLFGPDGLAEGLASGSLFIDCSTISPLKAQEFAERLGAQGVSMLDAPVSGGSEGAKNATLTIVNHLGPLGSGQWAKAINQVILCGAYLGVAEGVTLGLKAGLDVERVISALKGGAAGSWVLENRSGRMIEDDYPLGFKISLHRKDLAISLDLAQSVGAVLPVTAMAASFEDELIAEGHGDDDNSALARPIRKLSGL